MSETDARMAFERHATSRSNLPKIRNPFVMMGFRGEALASMAAVAQIDMRSRLHDRDLGTKIIIAGSQFIKQEPIQTPRWYQLFSRKIYFQCSCEEKIPQIRSGRTAQHHRRI